MALQRFISIFLALFLCLDLGSTQNPTPTPATTITGTATLTVPLESLYTDPIEPITTVTYTESSVTAVATGYLIGGLEANSVSVQPGYNISSFSDYAYATCWYPTSGNWALLPRILFYITIVFALLAREHEWLIAGALAASLTFSGVAAIQICAQIWSKQAVAELDLFPLLGILSTSCIIAVPLMNWSSTIRLLGLSEEEKQLRLNGHYRRVKHHKHQRVLPRNEDELPKDSGARTVIIFWAFLVAIGFITGFVGLVQMRNGADWILPFIWSGTTELHCVPPGGELDLNAGQYPGWEFFWVNAEFVAANNCDNPCSAVPPGYNTLFRSPSQDLQVLTAKSIDTWIEATQISSRLEHAEKFTAFYFKYLLYGLPYILLQGFMHLILFRRHSPQEARHWIYVTIVKEDDPGFHPGLLRRAFAFTLALFFYLLALFTLVVAPISLVLNIVATEIQLYTTPQSEDNTHVGQWGVMAGTILVLIAAFICRFEPAATYYAGLGGKKLTHRLLPDSEKQEPSPRPGMMRRKSSFLDKRFWSGMFGDARGLFRDMFMSLWYTIKNFAGIFSHEWDLFVQFWKNPLIEPKRRDKPLKPQSTRRNRQSQYYDKPTDIAMIASPQWQDYGEHAHGHAHVQQIHAHSHHEKNQHSATIHGLGVETNTHPALVNEAERPLLSHAQSTGHNDVVNRPGRSIAFANRQDSDKTPHSSPPLLAKRQNSHMRKPVPATQVNETEVIDDFDVQQRPMQTHLSPHSHSSQANRDSSTVMGSLSDSIANRTRRSNVYQPDQTDNLAALTAVGDQLSPTALPVPPQQALTHSRSREGLIPIEDDAVPPLPPPKSRNYTPPNRSPNLEPPAIPSPASHSSHLFTEDELAHLYRNGTPRIQSALMSRNSLADLLSGARGGDAPATTSSAAGRVSYLQIQTGNDFKDADRWGDQVVLRRDRYGRWVVVDAGEETIEEESEEDGRGGNGNVI